MLRGCYASKERRSVASEFLTLQPWRRPAASQCVRFMGIGWAGADSNVFLVCVSRAEKKEQKHIPELKSVRPNRAIGI